MGDTIGGVTLYNRDSEAKEKLLGHTEKVTGAKVYKDFGLCTVALDSKVCQADSDFRVDTCGCIRSLISRDVIFVFDRCCCTTQRR